MGRFGAGGPGHPRRPATFNRPESGFGTGTHIPQTRHEQASADQQREYPGLRLVVWNMERLKTCSRRVPMASRC